MGLTFLFVVGGHLLEIETRRECFTAFTSDNAYEQIIITIEPLHCVNDGDTKLAA